MRLLDAGQVFELHEHVLTRDGGLPGVRLGRSIDAVLARIENNLQFEFEADIKIAAALFAYAFAVGHIFNDANKRTAYIGSIVTLEINGIKTDKIDQSELETLIVAAASSDLEIEEFVSAFRDLLL